MTTGINPLDSRVQFDYEDYINLAKTAEFVAVDTESGPHRGMLGYSFAFSNGLGSFATYLPYNHADPGNAPKEIFEYAWEVLRTKKLVFHHAGHDIPILEHHGFKVEPTWYDTMLMEHWINENAPSFSLDAVSRRHGGQPKNRPPIMQFIIDNQGWDKVPIILMAEYGAHDSLMTIEAFDEIWPVWSNEFDEELWDYERKFVLLISKMIERGIRIDPMFTMTEIIRGEKIMNDCYQRLSFNPASRLGLERLLLDQIGLPIVEKTPKGKPSFDKKAMQAYEAMLENSNDKRASLILTYRGWQKTLGANYKNYLNLADNKGILHPNFKLHGTVTSRLSCEKPALQQIPRESQKDWNGNLKKAFIGRDGFRLYEADEAQLEFRLAGAYSEEPLLIEVFNTTGRNLFKEMADELGWPYVKTKTFNYATLYGSGVTNTSYIFDVDFPTARRIISSYYAKYPKLKETQDAVANLCRQRKWVKYWSGRRRHFPDPKRDSHKAFNSVIQGGAAELIKRWMIRLEEEVCDENCYMVLQVHDSVVFEVKEGMEDEYLPKIKKIMETPPIDFGVLFEVDIHAFGGGHDT